MPDGISFNNKELKATGTVYTDRLTTWDYEKHNKLCKKHFGNEGQYWDRRDPNKIESFLRDWFDEKKLKLVMIEQSTNRSSGYPLWRLDYNT